MVFVFLVLLIIIIMYVIIVMLFKSLYGIKYFSFFVDLYKEIYM